MKWEIKDSLPVKVGIIELSGLNINSSDLAYKQIQALAMDYHEQYKNTSVSLIPGIQTARDFFRAIGIDPTKRRPSSEALLRRALNKKGFFKVNNLVDAANLCSLQFLLPICAYDADKIEGGTQIRRGLENDNYLALTGKELNLEGRYVIADSRGPFGSPITDSVRTAVSQSTTSCVICIFAPNQLPDSIMTQYMTKAAEKIIELCRGKCTQRQIIQG